MKLMDKQVFKASFVAQSQTKFWSEKEILLSNLCYILTTMIAARMKWGAIESSQQVAVNFLK